MMMRQLTRACHAAAHMAEITKRVSPHTLRHSKGAWRDNVFVERLWRSVKYEEVYLRAYDSVGEARSSIGRYLVGFIRAIVGGLIYTLEPAYR